MRERGKVVKALFIAEDYSMLVDFASCGGIFSVWLVESDREGVKAYGA